MEIFKEGNPEKKYDFSISCQHCDCDFNCKITDTYPKTEWFFIFESKERLVRCPYCNRETEANEVRQFPVIVSKVSTKGTKTSLKDYVIGEKKDATFQTTTTIVSTPVKKPVKKKVVK